LITELQSRTNALKDAKTDEGKTERMRLGNSRGFLSTALQEWFREIHTRLAPDYAAFADQIVRPGDVVLTFNYDDSLERELKRAGKWEISHGYGFQLGELERPSEILVLKLHGNMNWLVSVFRGATGSSFFAISDGSSLGHHPVIRQVDLDYLGYKEFSGHTYKSGGAFPCLILPGRKKEFFYDTSLGHEYIEFWDLLWSQAAETLKRSDKIVVCGYSLLPVDRNACDLLLKNPRKETPIEIVSGSQSERIAGDFRSAGFGDVEVFKGGYFEDWLRAEIGRVEKNQRHSSSVS
jgi:hypothetical protein